MADGRIDKAVVADRCRRILFYKYLVGLDKPHPIADIDAAVADVGTDAPAMRDSITSALRRHMSGILRPK